MTHAYRLGALSILLVGGLVGGCSQVGPGAPSSIVQGGIPPGGGSSGFATPSRGGGGGTTGSDVYEYSGAGNITFDPVPATGHRNVGSGSDIGLGHPGDIKTLFLSSGLLSQLGGYSSCFGSSDPFAIPDFAGWLRVDKRGNVRGEFYFEALGTDGTTAFNYALVVAASPRDPSAAFPPAPGDTVVLDWGAGEMNTEGSGKGKKGSNEGSACVGPVSATGSMTVTGVS